MKLHAHCLLMIAMNLNSKSHDLIVEPLNVQYVISKMLVRCSILINVR